MNKKIALCFLSGLLVFSLVAFIFYINSVKAQNIESDIESLLKLATSNTRTENFKSILELRDIGDERAIPVLKKILIQYTGTGNIFGFAAAQALFCIGGEEANNILHKYILFDKYDTRLSLMYTFHWDMNESKRDAFIQQYHLQNTSDDIRVGVKAKDLKEGNTQQIEFTVTLKNISKKPLHLYGPKTCLGGFLLLCSPKGHFMKDFNSFVDFKYQDPFPEILKLLPGEIMKFYIIAKPCRTDSSHFKNLSTSKIVLDCGSKGGYALEESGKYKVYGIYSVGRRTAEGLAKTLKLSEVWSGRVVSKPIEVEIMSK